MKTLLTVAFSLFAACSSVHLRDNDTVPPARWSLAAAPDARASAAGIAQPGAAGADRLVEHGTTDGFAARWTNRADDVDGEPSSGQLFSSPYRDDNWVGKSYTKAKVGGFSPSGDFSSFDDGFAGELVFGREILALLSIEGSVGYLAGDGPSNSDYSVIPLFVQARLNIPILIFEAYGGGGIGGVYADIGGAGAGTGTDFVGAGTAFLGLEVGLGNLALGLEGKYIISQEINSAVDFEGTQVTLGLKLPF